ncbi:MAG: hypothetical protein WCA89_10915 [Terracidiphilus sp.]
MAKGKVVFFIGEWKQFALAGGPQDEFRGDRMFESMGITSQARVFPCPVCKETIDTSALKCRFCSASIDPGAAEAAADAMARVNQACSDASYLKVMAIAVLVAFALSFAPIVGFLGYWGLIFLLFAVPFMVVRWWVKFGSIQTNESDFSRARGIVIAISIPGFIFPFVGLFLLFGMLVRSFGH